MSSVSILGKAYAIVPDSIFTDFATRNFALTTHAPYSVWVFGFGPALCVPNRLNNLVVGIFFRVAYRHQPEDQ
jgi:hypothetical protein